ncbi:MAG: hypothetical protein K2Y37_10320 [Pirellulales bacterium]|nr:hypothetical protein [Pirellulales bacterium]
MAVDPTTDLERFRDYLSGCLSQGNGLSPEEALDLWRSDNPSGECISDDVEAVRQALADMDAGDKGVPLEEFDREFRKRHGLPSAS